MRSTAAHQPNGPKCRAFEYCRHGFGPSQLGSLTGPQSSTLAQRRAANHARIRLDGQRAADSTMNSAASPPCAARRQ